jgi:Zincin-like metallopeptidase
MAAVSVCNRINLPTDFQNHAAYVTGWLKKLREDKRELLSCTADAERIVQYTLSYHPSFKDKSLAPSPAAYVTASSAVIGISSHVRPSSVLPCLFFCTPPHCLKKNGTEAFLH